MKIIPGTGRKKEKEANEERSGSFTKTTSGEPSKKKNTEFKIPKSVTDDPVKSRYQRSVRPITNGHIIEHSYHDSDGNYQRHEVFSEQDPFGHVEGLE